MRVIASGKEPIAKTWCASSDRTCRYRLMRYHVRVDSAEGILLLNTVTGELVLLNSEEVELLECLPETYRPEMDELIEHRFLVPETFNELVSVIQLRRVLRSLRYPRKEVINYTILPTTVCNARCFYCYESAYPRRSMSREITERLVDYIESHCGETKKVHLSWFGGEPTLGEKNIDCICEHLERKGISFTSSMISNGYLFSRDMAHKAQASWHLQRIQITLDGTEEKYNSVKSYVDPDGSPYKRVINNIRFLLDEKIRVSIRMNLERHNADNLKELIDELAEKFPNDDNFSVYVHEIFEGMGYEPIQRSKEELQQLIEKMLVIKSYIDEKGLKQTARGVVRELPYLKPTYCMADNPSSVLVNPEGRLGKCQHVQYEHLFGELQNEDSTNKDELLYWMNSQSVEGCNECPLFPWCGVPNTCAGGRTCIPMEVDRKMNDIRELCHKKIVNNNGLQEV